MAVGRKAFESRADVAHTNRQLGEISLLHFIFLLLGKWLRTLPPYVQSPCKHYPLDLDLFCQKLPHDGVKDKPPVYGVYKDNHLACNMASQVVVIDVTWQDVALKLIVFFVGATLSYPRRSFLFQV